MAAPRADGTIDYGLEGSAVERGFLTEPRSALPTVRRRDRASQLRRAIASNGIATPIAQVPDPTTISLANNIYRVTIAFLLCRPGRLNMLRPPVRIAAYVRQAR